MLLATWRAITFLESARIVLGKKIMRMARTFGEMFGHGTGKTHPVSAGLWQKIPFPETQYETPAAPQSQILITIKNYGKEFNAKAVCVNCGKTFFNEWGGVIPGDEFGFFVTDHKCAK